VHVKEKTTKSARGEKVDTETI